MGDRDSQDEIAARHVLGLGNGKGTRQDVRRNVPRWQHRIEVERIDQLAVGKAGSEDGAPLLGTEDRRGAVTAT